MFRLEAHSRGRKIYTSLLTTQILHFQTKLALPTCLSGVVWRVQ